MGMAFDGSRALLDLIEECERETVVRSSPPASLDLLAGELPPPAKAAEGGRVAVEALVALVRREVREAVAVELQQLRAPSSPSSSSAAAAAVAPPGAAVAQESGEAALLDVVAAQRRAIASLQADLACHAEHWDRTWKEQAELRAEGDQEVEARLGRRLGDRVGVAEAQLAQVSASVGSLARLQVELGSEAKIRQEADGRLQMFLRDFREHVVGEVEELWAKHRQLSVGVEGMRTLLGQQAEAFGRPPSARVAGPDELADAPEETRPPEGGSRAAVKAA